MALHSVPGLAVAVLCALAVGCVPKVRYDRAVQDAQSAQVAARKRQGELEKQVADTSEASERCAQNAEKTRAKLEGELSARDTTLHNARRELDEQTAINEKLRGELTRLGKDVDGILRDKGTLEHSLAEAKARLNELRAAQDAAAKRAALEKAVLAKLQQLPSSGQFVIERQREGLAVIVPSDLLFAPNKPTELRMPPLPVLVELGGVLRDLKDWRIQVRSHASSEGLLHAKNVWEQSAAQAVDVVRWLTSKGVPSAALSGAAYGDAYPTANAAFVALVGPVRSKNRIELLLDSSPSVPSVTPGPSASSVSSVNDGTELPSLPASAGSPGSTPPRP